MRDLSSINGQGPGETTDSWGLVNKAWSRYKLGLLDEAVVACDEVVEKEMVVLFERLGIPKPIGRENAIQTLRKEGVNIEARRLLHLRNLRERAEKARDSSMTKSDAEDAIRIAERFISKTDNHRDSDQTTSHGSSSPYATLLSPGLMQFRHGTGNKAIPSVRSNHLRSTDGFSPPYGGTRPSEFEFITKLLLARAILNFKKKRIPRTLGLLLILVSGAVCLLFSFTGGYGMIRALTGQSLFSIYTVIADILLFLVAYLFLKIALFVKRGTR